MVESTSSAAPSEPQPVQPLCLNHYQFSRAIRKVVTASLSAASQLTLLIEWRSVRPIAKSQNQASLICVFPQRSPELVGKIFYRKNGGKNGQTYIFKIK